MNRSRAAMLSHIERSGVHSRYVVGDYVDEEFLEDNPPCIVCETDSKEEAKRELDEHIDAFKQFHTSLRYEKGGDRVISHDLDDDYNLFVEIFTKTGRGWR